MDHKDDRKLYILDLVCSFFDLKKEKLTASIKNDESLNRFLDDLSCNFLRVLFHENACDFSNELPESAENSEPQSQLIFIKLKPEVLTEETIRSSIFVMTLFGSPLFEFHQTLNSFYIPAMMNHKIGREPQVQNTLKVLDGQLKCAIFQSDASQSLDLTNLHDEIRYWESVAESAKNSADKKAAKSVWKILRSVEDDLSSLERIINVDVDDIVESCVSMLDDLWRIEYNVYDQKRMKKLIEMIGNVVALHILKKIDEIDVWRDEYDRVKDVLDFGIQVCAKWNDSIHTLCTVYWSSSNQRQWLGDPYVHEFSSNLKSRLIDIKSVRSAHRQLTRLLSASEQKELDANSSFSFFADLNPKVTSPQTERLWKLALQQFEKSLVSMEHRVAMKLKNQFNHLNANTLQLVEEIKRYEELLKRPNIAKHLLVERQNLLAVFQEYIDGVTIDGVQQEFPLLDLPPTVNRIYWARLLYSKIKEMSETNGKILSDLNGSEELGQKCNAFMSQLKKYEKEQFDQWTHEVRDDIKIKELSLSETSKVLRFKAGQLVEVNYPSRLVRLVREVQQLSALNLTIPKSIRDIAERAVKFMNQAKDLEQIANFHNTIGERIIPSQKPMLLPSAQKLDYLINSQQAVTWSDTAAVDKYISNLQQVVKGLSMENNKLAFYHQKICDKVLGLLNADLLRQQNFWKQTLRDVREMIAQVEFMKFPNMKSWKLHWDYQLYKALEWQYRLSLCNLHLHFPEIKVELIYRQQRLQFHPPMEEIRMKYYGQVKRFLSIPHSINGFSENTQRLFSTIVFRNGLRFEDVFVEAEKLFDRLKKLKREWSQWMRLGGVNVEEMTEKTLKNAEDWDLNFRASKKIGQEAAKLQYNDVQIGCITVSVLPIRAEIELHNRKYWDALTMSLQMSILRDISHLDRYISESTEIMNLQPKTMSEVGEANVKHARLMETSVEMQKAFESTVKKNKTLASWTKEKIEAVNQLIFSWENFQNNLKNHKSLIGRQVERMKIALNGDTENLLLDIEKFRTRWEVQKPKDTDVQDANPETLKRNIQIINEKLKEWNELKEKKEKLEEECRKFEMSPPDMSEFEMTDEEMQKYHFLWSFYDEFQKDLSAISGEDWILFRGKTYKFDELLQGWEKKIEDKETNPVTVKMLQEIHSYKALARLFNYLRGDMFSDKHWIEMFVILGMENKPPETLTLRDFLAVRDKIIAAEEKLQALNKEAASEITIRQALAELDAWEVQARFTVTPNTDAGSNNVMLIKDYSDVLSKLGDNQCLLQSIINSPNAKSFSDRTTIWENKLSALEDLVSDMNAAQRKWVYLEPIFRNGTFVIEQARFERVDQDFRYVMGEVCKDNRVVALLRIVNLRTTLSTMIDQFNRCQNSLNQYLQEKRSIFPRFYFLGDEDLLELLGQSAKEQVIQSHLKKIFAGINSVTISDGHVHEIKSLQEEIVKLNSPVKVTNTIEEWLKNLGVEVKKTLKSLLIKYQTENAGSSRELDPLAYPSQILCLGEAIWFAAACESHISSGKLRDLYDSVKEKLHFYSKNLENWQDGDSLLQLKLKALLSDTAHHLGIVEILLEHRVTNIGDWYWQKQLRYYLDSEKNVIVRMVDAELEYTYEYQGNGAKLVRTPLTEKCFLTLTQAIKMGLGGNPFGPAGTGKTESVKALGGLLGRQVLVFNCDRGIDLKSMGRIFIGLVKCGAWGCFDEFNRLEEATLSAVSMIIQPIQVALQEGKKTVKILDEEVPIDPNCGLFVTLNPAGKKYGGRKKLPNNLKQLFRPVVMSTPDEALIAQISLLCDGFKEAKAIGPKIVEIFDLAKNVLSKQQHYDWGLRALKTVLGSCGSLYRRKPHGEKISELEVAVEAVRLNTLSKLTFKDSVLFDRIVKDVFVDVKFIGSDFAELTSALKASCDSLGLQYNENQVKKCIELYEQMQQRMGVAVVGPSGTGKSTILKLLRTALQKLGRTVRHFILNPKSMERTQFFGQVDVDTRQWTEGVLTATALRLQSENTNVLSWLICDGDVDPDWVEALNSVLDDNRLLTLPSGWRIHFGPNVNFLFETSDLNHASPATVSRMGIIFLSEQIIDVTLIVNSWLASRTSECRRFLEPYISDYFYKCVDWIRRNGDIVVPYSVIGLVKSGLSQLEKVQTKAQFTMALINGLGANLTAESRETFAKSVFELTGEFVPNPSRILECYYNVDRNRIDALSQESNHSDVSDGFNLVLTASAKVSVNALKPWMNSFQPILVAGSEGSGKTLLIEYCLTKQHAIEVVTIYCGQLVTPNHVVQKLKQVCSVTVSSTGRVLRPKNSQKVVLLLKNLEWAAPDIWGTNMLITWLQQLITYQGFYESDLEWTGIERIQIIGTVSDGPYYPNVRFTSITRIYHQSSPNSNDLKAIYLVYVKSVMAKNFQKHNVWSSDNKILSLVSSLIGIHEKVRSAFTKMKENHYSFTPKDLTRWCVEIQRYQINSSEPVRSMLEVVAYVGFRLFSDRFVNDKDRKTFRQIICDVFENEWTLEDLIDRMDDLYFVSDESRKFLRKIEKRDWAETVKKGISAALGKENEILIIDELLRLASSIDGHFSAPNTSIILAGKSGVGRKVALRTISFLHSARLFTLNVSQNYNTKSFKIDLKAALQSAGAEGELTYLLIEHYQIVDVAFLDMLNVLLDAGEVPDLYKSDELESAIAVLKDSAASEGYSGSIASFFASRVLKNLHVALILDVNDKLNWISEKYPRLFSKCAVIWCPEWSPATMKVIPRMLFASRNMEGDIDPLSEVSNFTFEIHQEFQRRGATPRRFLAFVQTYIRMFNSKKQSMVKRIKELEAGVTKLNQTKIIVDSLKKEAEDQKEKLAEKQREASTALNLIGETMRNANTHKEKMEKLREQAVLESKQLTDRKRAIDEELAEVRPLIEEARQAVGNIRNESLSEIRSLRAPPDAIRDILEGVLRLMGIQDTSWNNMKNFLAKRGVKEEIRTFDAHHISEDSKEAVKELLAERSYSFDPKVAKRASVAAAPLAAWVKANMKYAMVLDKIRPLEREQKKLELNLSDIEDQVGTISTGLGEVDERVNELKNRLNTYTREAAVIEIHLAKAQDTMASAQELIAKLEDEYERWTSQLNDLAESMNLLPRNALLAAAFLTYLSASSENDRKNKLREWETKFGGIQFSVVEFLASERDRLKWIAEGLSTDELSIENAVVILESWLHPLLVDPTGTASNWLKTHFASQNLEVLQQHSLKLQTTLEFAVRFGKTLVIEEVDEVHPVLIPLLRKDIISQGPREIIYVGEKLVDYNRAFRLFLITKNPEIRDVPDANIISFTVTQQGLAGQLLGLAVDQEKPELGTRRMEFLRKEEEMKFKLYNLQENLLEQLATAQGNLLENKDLIHSLNQTKTSGEEISKALDESKKLELQLDREYQSYRDVADFGSRLYFTIKSLSEINPVYQFSIDSFKNLFRKSLKFDHKEGENQREQRNKNLIRVVYHYVSRSLFNSDRLAFALRLYANTHSDEVTPQEWSVFKGEATFESQIDQRLKDSLPEWVPEDRHFYVGSLKSALPDFYSQLRMREIADWLNFGKSRECEREVPNSLAVKMSPFQILLVIQAFRPDRLYSAMTRFVLHALDIKTLSPSSVRLSDVAQESTSTEPILIMVSPGADPSNELRTLARTMPTVRLHEIAMGEGQTDAAAELLKSCSANGDWLCLKNLQLVTTWLGDLEKTLNSLNPHPDFRLWMTTEPHEDFSKVLASSCLKVTYEAPPGIKKNLQKTFASWSSDTFRRKGVLFGRTMFAAAWFHAVVQERRIYIPQGWSTFHEFSDSDLRATLDLITKLFSEGSSSVDWAFIRGLLSDSIYGGRMDNQFDIEILGSYLREFFDESSLKRGDFASRFSLPSTESYSEYLQLIHQLDDFDRPALFGLPDNIETSWQKIKSSVTLDQLKALEQSAKVLDYDTSNWQQNLSPVLNAWKKLNQNVGLIEIKLSDKKFDKISEDPIVDFLRKDFEYGLRVVQSVHQTLAAINKVIRSVAAADPCTILIARSLIDHQTPGKWQNTWEGPENPFKYLSTIVGKAATLQKMAQLSTSDDILREDVDLSLFFQPHRFLKAFKQRAARKSKIPLDKMILRSRWRDAKRTADEGLRVKNLQLEGAAFDGRLFVATTVESPSSITAPPASLSYVDKDLSKPDGGSKEALFPVYRTSKRETLLMTLNVPCKGDKDDWYKTGAAFYLRD